MRLIARLVGYIQWAVGELAVLSIRVLYVDGDYRRKRIERVRRIARRRAFFK